MEYPCLPCDSAHGESNRRWVPQLAHRPHVCPRRVTLHAESGGRRNRSARFFFVSATSSRVIYVYVIYVLILSRSLVVSCTDSRVQVRNTIESFACDLTCPRTRLSHGPRRPGQDKVGLGDSQGSLRLKHAPRTLVCALHLHLAVACSGAANLEQCATVHAGGTGAGRRPTPPWPRGPLTPRARVCKATRAVVQEPRPAKIL